ncbi:MAG: amidohydrolase family protein, partial [Rhodospirillaceae bacterium]|nr:amidohydrolase family protein [Rhodospirillaceae bacterium]
WITSVPARVLGIDNRVGSVTPGKDADVVVWSGDPFSTYSRPEQVFIDGALLYDRATAGRRVSDFELGQPAQEARP